jgi:peptide deformylase
MTILRILQYPDPRLRTKAKRVEVFDERIKKIISDMFETHYASDNCAALAATQLNIENPPMITVIDFSEYKNQPLCLVNPEIVEREGTQTQEEGCMSLAAENHSVFDKVTRSQKIRVKALDRNGNPLDFIAEGFMAKCIQHEIDHLHGKIFIDHLSRLKRDRLEKKLFKLRREDSE